MRVLFGRFVVAIEAGEDGVLRPQSGAAWHWEPANGEGRVHHELARLVDGTPAQIAAFASTHGLLRRAGGRLAGLGRAYWARPLLTMGQRLGDDVATIRHGLEGSGGRVEELDRAMLAVLAELSEPVRQAFALAASDAPAADVEAALGGAVPDPAAFLTTFGEHLAPYIDGTKPITFDRLGMARSSEILEWAAGLLGGTDDAPEWVNQLGGVQAAMLSLLGNLPEALLDPRLINQSNVKAVPAVEALARETVEDWREVASGLTSWCEAVRLVRRATDGAGIARAEKDRLAELYQGLAEVDAPASLTAGELGERTRALLRAACETLLAEVAAWPIRRGSVVGLYGRALGALWTELTDEEPLIACATPGCPGSFAPTRNRVYCADCELNRRREDVRRVRAKAGGQRRRGVGEVGGSA